MQVHLAFGQAGLDLELPSGPDYRILEARSAAPLADSVAAIEQALDAPLAGPPLRDLARGRRSAAISICDITRPAPNRLTLPPLLRRLHEADLPPERVTLCIATGLHRLATDAELQAILGPGIYGKYPVYNHNARETAEHTSLGQTASGTPVAIATAFLEADLHLTLGFIEPHLMAGFSGGRKLVAPGLAHEDTIKTLHSPRFMRDVQAAEGLIAGNPLHAELLEISRLARHDFLLDVALSRDRQIAGVFAGAPEIAHAAGVRFVSQTLLESLDQPADAVVTTCAGYPLDLTFYQAIKGVTAAAHIVKPGGRILLFAECAEGAGAHEFRDLLFRCHTAHDFLDLLAGAPVTVDQWMLEKLALVMQKAEVLFYVPGLARDQQQALWGPAFDTPGSAVRAALEGLPPGAKVAVIPEGPYVLARVFEGAKATA